MTDLLTHVLAVFIGVRLHALWREPIDAKYVPVAMAGATLPDLAKVNYLLPTQAVVAATGLPFSWLPLHRLGGVVAVSVVVALFFAEEHRRTVLTLLLYGAASHLVLDGLIRRANGLTPPYLYPLSWWRPPSGDVYLSSDVWPAILATAIVLLLLVARRLDVTRRGRSDGD